MTPSTQANNRWMTKKLELVLIVVGILLMFTAAKTAFDDFIYDLTLNVAEVQNEDHVVIIEVDDKSLAHLGAWPWSRSVHADLVNIVSLSQPAAIGFDIIFLDRNNTDGGDDKFAAALATAGNVILPIAPSSNAGVINGELIPIPEFASKAAGLGHIDYEIETDGTIRRVYLYAGYKSAHWPSFGLALANLANPTNSFPSSADQIGDFWVRQYPMLVNFHNASLGFTKYSYVDVLQGAVPPELFVDKVVLVGINAAAMGDKYITPVSHSHQAMTGVEINAYHTNDLINQAEVHVLSGLELWVIYTALLIASFIVLKRTPLEQLLRVLLLLLIADLAFCYAIYVWFMYWFPPATIIGGQVCIYAVLALLRSQDLTQEVGELHHDLVHDRVTGLANEAGLLAFLRGKIETTSPQALQLMTIRFGKFKGINDLLGSDAGDTLLNLAKQRIEELLPNALFKARYHGSEFSICLPAENDVAAVKKQGAALLNVLQQPFVVHNEHFRLPVNIGVSTFPTDATDVKSLRDATQSALHRSQEVSEPNICIYSHDIKQKLLERAKLESDLAQALTNNEIEIYYQPQVESNSGRIVGAEALARWNHKSLGLVSPDVFIPVAESTGLIIEIGTWILRQACLQAKKIQDEGNKDFRIAVNLSSLQFAYTGLVDEVKSALKNANLAPQFLELELTESCVVDDIKSAIETLNQLKAIGVGLSIDDFGTGYSSLSYLKHFPMDRIKIDRSFVNEINSSKNAQEIALAIISMAHSLNMEVIAEGIETQEQQLFMSEHKVQELQGFYFGRPLQVDKLESLMKQHNEVS